MGGTIVGLFFLALILGILVSHGSVVTTFAQDGFTFIEKETTNLQVR